MGLEPLVYFAQVAKPQRRNRKLNAKPEKGIQVDINQNDNKTSRRSYGSSQQTSVFL
jgi:hypothetical protein